MSANGYFRGMNRQQKRALSKSDTINSIEQFAKELEKTNEAVKRVDQDVDTLLELLLKDPRAVGEALQKGDTVIVGFLGRLYKDDGSVSEMPFQGGTTDNMIIQQLESGQMIPGFESQITRQNVGSTFDIDVTFPADYQAKELAGKKATFLIVVHAAFVTRSTVGIIQSRQNEMIQTLIARQKAEQEAALKASQTAENTTDSSTDATPQS